jgi:hypothetical protein
MGLLPRWGSSITLEPYFVPYNRGFRLVLPNATSPAPRPGMGAIEPVTDTAIAIWDRLDGSGLVHAAQRKVNSSDELFRTAEAIVDDG